jgi:hypothetical protein
LFICKLIIVFVILFKSLATNVSVCFRSKNHCRRIFCAFKKNDDNDISADAPNFHQREPFLRTYNGSNGNGYQKQQHQQQQKAPPPTAYQYQQRTTYRETSA